MLQQLDSIFLFVKDTHRTAQFYRDLGFTIRHEGDEVTIAAIDDFTIHCYDKEKIFFKYEADTEPKGAGVFFYVRVGDVDEYYRSIKQAGFEPISEPRDWPWGNREFVVRDPDGYKLVMYQKL